MLAWQTLPPGGLGINTTPSSFWVSDLPGGVDMRAGRSNESARDCLTKSSRLVDFCSSSNSFYGLNCSVGLSSPCTHRCVDHPTDLCLIRSPTCSFGPLSPFQFILSRSPFNILLFSWSDHPFIPSLLSPCVSETHCVLWDRNCSRLKESFSSGLTGSHHRPGKWTPGRCGASFATYQEYVNICHEEKKQ